MCAEASRVITRNVVITRHAVSGTVVIDVLMKGLLATTT
jgi:hypothetical protein